MRSTRSRTKNRRSHHALKEPTLSKCSKCNALGKPHIMCGSCGFYNGRQVEDLEAKRAKRDARIKAKQDRMRVESEAPESEEVTDAQETAGEEETTDSDSADTKKKQ